MHEGRSHANRFRQIVTILFLWAILLTLTVAIASAKSLSFLDGQIQVYPAQREGDRILIPFSQPPPDNEEVLLLGPRSKLIPLKLLQQETILPQSMAHPRPHYVYGLTEGELLGTRAQFLVVAGKGITGLLKWNADDTMSGKLEVESSVRNQLLANLSTGPMSSMPDNANTLLSLDDIKISAGLMSSNSANQLTDHSCVKPDKGFAITSRQVLISRELKERIYYVQEAKILETVVLQSTPDKIFGGTRYSGPSMKEMVGIIKPDNSCRTLASATSDGYGLYAKGSLTPVGPISGIMELSTGEFTERWLVLKSAMREIWGYTFIELLPMPLTREPKWRFLLEDRG
ncbi:MAG: hypothetical protein P0121_09085 [Nitrospira sp.]|nr:hypothetical protein [Nitrospira sp.]